MVRILGVGARGMVLRPQFNGKQEGGAVRSTPNLRCPRNGKWTDRLDPAPSWPLSTCSMYLGRRVGLSPPARIPANNGGVPA